MVENEEPEYFPMEEIEEEKKPGTDWSKWQEKINQRAALHEAEIRHLEAIEDNSHEIPGWRKAMRRLGRLL